MQESGENGEEEREWNEQKVDKEMCQWKHMWRERYLAREEEESGSKVKSGCLLQGRHAVHEEIVVNKMNLWCPQLMRSICIQKRTGYTKEQITRGKKGVRMMERGREENGEYSLSLRGTKVPGMSGIKRGEGEESTIESISSI